MVPYFNRNGTKTNEIKNILPENLESSTPHFWKTRSHIKQPSRQGYDRYDRNRIHTVWPNQKKVEYAIQEENETYMIRNSYKKRKVRRTQTHTLALSRLRHTYFFFQKKKTTSCITEIQMHRNAKEQDWLKKIPNVRPLQ